MKTKLLLAALALALSTISSQLSTLHAQGALTPPGAPAPTMKSLDQVEARIAITNTSTLVTISQPGSYYLTGNLTVSSGNGININTNGVTLDLNGFTISSTASTATGSAIVLFGNRVNIAIYNGHISSGVTNSVAGVFSGSGFSSGIYYSGSQPLNVRVKNVSVTGVLSYGINIGQNNSIVDACTVNVAGIWGITAEIVSDSIAKNCGSTAIVASTARDSYGYSILNGVGVNADNAAMGCYGESVNGIGLSAYNASYCVGYQTGGTAISATIATGCIAKAGTNLITYKYNMP